MIRPNVITSRTKFYGIYIVLMTVIILTLITISEFNSYNDEYTEVKDITSSLDLKKEKSEILDNGAISFTVQNGDTFNSILKKAGISDSYCTEIISAMKKEYNPSRISIGQNISLFYEDNNIEKLSAIKLSVSPERTIEISKNFAGNFVAKEVFIPLVKHYVHVNAPIESSLFASASTNDIPQSVVTEIVKAFSYDVDFQRDIHEGDSFDIVYERYYDEQGNFARDGKPVFMSLTLGGENIKMYYFENKAYADYFTEEGASIKKELLKTPVNAARISGTFGVRKKHPVLGYTAMHKGVDFAAPIGTPIYAAGDGVIEEIGRKGTYGNYIRIRHNGTYSTAYAHCSRFTKGLRVGSRVKQGDVIAAVGTTGRSTGPHLHFEVLKNNAHINPLNVKFSSNFKLKGSDYREYKAFVAKISRKLVSMPSHTEIAADTLNNLW